MESILLIQRTVKLNYLHVLLLQFWCLFYLFSSVGIAPYSNNRFRKRFVIHISTFYQSFQVNLRLASIASLHLKVTYIYIHRNGRFVLNLTKCAI